MAKRSRNVTVSPRKRGRPKRFHEQLRLPLTAGTIASIDAVRREGESRVEIIRQAIVYYIALAPGHTDLMVSPESFDIWLEDNPLPKPEDVK